MSDKTFFVSTPIYYVNDIPHIGHAYTTIAADTITRYKEMRGYDVFFLTGTDEHGQKIEQAAREKNITPKELADSVVERFKNLWEKLNIKYTSFIRTTDELHIKTVQKVFAKMQENNDIYLGDYEGWYCTPCETYWTDLQLMDGNVCPSCGRQTARLKEASYFFRMSKYQDKLLKHIKDNPDFVKPVSRRNEIISFIEEGLKDLSVSRTSFNWGIPVPGDNKHIIYVWIDALTNYISALNYYEEGETFKKYWPADYHLVGKDILRFHTVYWPTMLMSIGEKLPKSVFAHGWWTVEGQKMSKSLGNAINPYWLVDTFGVDAIRYFLLREVPFGLDGDFSFKTLIHRINSDLANDLGNLLNRTTGMIARYFNGVIPEYTTQESLDLDIEKTINNVFEDVDFYMNNLEYNKALIKIWDLINALNKYIDTCKPWALAKDMTSLSSKERLGSVMYILADTIRIISILIYPFMPKTSENINKQLSIAAAFEEKCDELNRTKLLKPGTKLGKTEALFPRIDESIKLKEIETSTTKKIATKELIDIDYFKKIDLMCVKVLKAECIKKSDKLIKLYVDTGSGEKQIIAGIGKFYRPDDLIGKHIAVVNNLAPTKLMGELSEGMVLAASSEVNMYLLTLPESIPPGTIIK